MITELFVVFEVFSQYRPKIGLDSTEEKKLRKLTIVIYKSTCIDTYKHDTMFEDRNHSTIPSITEEETE